MPTVADKLGMTSGTRAYLMSAPREIRRTASARGLSIARRLNGKFDFIHAFVTSQKQLDTVLPRLCAHLGPRGKLWISWPKNRQLETDLTLLRVIKSGYDRGVVESKTISIDETWSALKFTHPKEGVQYKNSFGKLAH